MSAKSAILGAILLVCYLFSFAQVEVVSDADYRQKLIDAKGRKERVAALMSMPESFIEENAEEALGLTNELLERVRRDDDKLAKANLLQGIAYYNLDRYDEADEHLKTANNYAPANNKNDNRLRADIEYYLGSVAGFKGSYAVAKSHGEKALVFAVELGDDELKTYILSELAKFEDNLGDLDKALEYHLQAYKIDQKRKDSASIDADLGNIAGIYHRREEYQKAIDYYKESFKYINPKNPNSDSSIAMNYNNLGNIYLRLKDLKKADSILTIGKHLVDSLNLKKEAILIYLNLCSLEIKNNQWNDARNHLRYANSLIEQTGNTANNSKSKMLELELLASSKEFTKVIDLTNQLLQPDEFTLSQFERLNVLSVKSDAEYNLGKYKDSRLTLSELLAERKKHNTAESIKELERFQTIYDIDKKDLEIENLNQQAELDRQNLKFGKIFRNILFALFLLSLGFLLFLRNTFNQRKKIRQLEHDRVMNSLNTEISTMQNRIAGLIDQQPQIIATNQLPPIEQINSALMDPLTEREYDILKSMEDGKSNKEIGSEHFISVNTVKYHLKNIYLKLDANNRVQALQKIRSI